MRIESLSLPDIMGGAKNREITNRPTAARATRVMAAMKTIMGVQSEHIRTLRAAGFVPLQQPILTRDPGISELCPLSSSPRIPSRTGCKGQQQGGYPGTDILGLSSGAHTCK